MRLTISLLLDTTPESCADGTGGTVKSLCNRAVMQRKDVTSVEDVIAVVKKSSEKIKIFSVTTEDIEVIDRILKKDIWAIPKTMKILQLMWSSKEKCLLFTNSLYCTQCIPNLPCKHYSLQKTGFNITATVIKRKKLLQMKNQRIPPYQKSSLTKFLQLRRQPKKVLRPKQVFKGPGTKNRNEKKAYNNSKKKNQNSNTPSLKTSALTKKKMLRR